jgi:hypothetical protein
MVVKIASSSPVSLNNRSNGSPLMPQSSRNNSSQSCDSSASCSRPSSFEQNSESDLAREASRSACEIIAASRFEVAFPVLLTAEGIGFVQRSFVIDQLKGATLSCGGNPPGIVQCNARPQVMGATGVELPVLDGAQNVNVDHVAIHLFHRLNEPQRTSPSATVVSQGRAPLLAIWAIPRRNG